MARHFTIPDFLTNFYNLAMPNKPHFKEFQPSEKSTMVNFWKEKFQLICSVSPLLQLNILPSELAEEKE